MSYDLGEAHGRITLSYDGNREVDSAERDMDRLDRKSKDTDKSTGKLGATLKGLGQGVKLTGLAVSLTNAAVGAASLGIQLLGIVPNLVAIGSLAAALPALITGGVAAVQVLKAAFAGVSDTVAAAFDTENPEKFNEALEKLSPSAREFAVAFRGIVPELKAVQQGIQEAFFGSASLDTAIPRALSGLNAIRPQLNGLAGDFGKAAGQVTKFALSGSSITFIRDSITGLRAAFASVTPSITPLLTGLRDVGGVGVPLLNRLGEAVGGVATKFGTWLSAVAADGRLEGWINTAIGTLGTLGGIAKNIGSILNSIFSTANATGGGLLGTIQTITGQFATFLNSAEGSSAITTLFSSILQIAAQLAPVLSTLAGALAGALGPALGQIATQVGPILLDVINQLSPALGPVATAIADILSAVAPLAAPLATIIGMFATLAGGVLSTIATNLQPITSVIGSALTGALTTLAPVLDTIIAQFPKFATAGTQIATALLPLVPAVITLASTFATALLPVIPQLTDAAIQLLPSIVELATVLSTNLAESLTLIAPIIPPILSVFVAFQGAILQVVNVLIQAITWIASFGGAIQVFASAATAVQQFGTMIGTAFSTAWNFVVTLGGQIIAWFSSLPGIVGGFLSSLPGLIGGLISSAFTQLLTFFSALPGQVAAFLAPLPGTILNIVSAAVLQMAYRFGQGIGLVLTLVINFPARVGAALSALAGIVGNAARAAWDAVKAAFQAGVNFAVFMATRFPGQVVGAIRSLGGLISGVARSAWNALKSAFSSGVSAAVGFARALPGRARSAIASLTGLLSSAASAAWNALKSRFTSGVSDASGVAQSLPGRIKSAVGNLGSLLVGAGRDAVMGLVNGIKGAIGAAVSAAASVGSAVVGGIKSTLKIKSPSRVMMELGRYVTQGFAKGITGSLSQAKSAAQKLSNLVTDAFNTDKNKKKKGVQNLLSAKQKNSVQAILNKGLSQLDALTKRSDAVAAKLKAAQEKLKAAQDAYNTSFNDAKKSVTGAFDLVSPGQQFVDLDQTKERFKATVDAAKQYAKDIANLTKRGLNKDLIQQLLDAGVEGGGAMARALASGTNQDIKDFNKLQEQLNKTGDSVGKTVADKFYGAGLNAAKGLVKGLQAQDKAIQKQMDKIAANMIKAIKKALKIKSPSRITFQVGKFTTQGLIDGLASLRTQVNRAAANLAESAVAPTLALGAPSTVPVGVRTAQMARALAPQAASSITQVVNALPGMSAKQVADYGLTKLTLALTTGVGATSIPAPATQGVA